MEKVFKYLKSIDKNLLIIFISSLVILWPLVSSQYMRGHDTFYHYANIFALNINFDFSSFMILSNKILPIIAYDFGWGEGIFYPSLPHYLAVYIYKFVSIIGVTNVFSTMKICHFIILFFSGLFMYYFVSKIFCDKKAGLVGSIIYMTYPYHYIDIFVRDAFSECFMFVFVPVVFLGLEYLFEKNYSKFYVCFVFGYVGAIFCHLVLSIYLTLFVIIYLLLNYKKLFNKSVIMSLLISSVFIILITSPFLLPLLEHTLFGNYTVYINGLMYTLESFKNTFVGLMDYFSFDRPLAWTGKLVFTVSFPALVLLILVLINCVRTKKINMVYKYFIFVILVIIFMSPFFPWTLVPAFLKNIQFVWRLNLFLAFFISICASSVVLFYKEKTNVIIVIVTLITSFMMMWSFKPMVILEEFDISKIDINKHGAASYQYIPSNSYKNLNYVKKRKKDIIIIEGDANISKVISKSPYMSFEIKTKSCTLELPRYYFFGYKITLNGKKIKYKENKRGFIELHLRDSGKVVVSYDGTLGYKISCVLSVFGVLLLLLYLQFDKIKLMLARKE